MHFSYIYDWQIPETDLSVVQPPLPLSPLMQLVSGSLLLHTLYMFAPSPVLYRGLSHAWHIQEAPCDHSYPNIVAHIN